MRSVSILFLLLAFAGLALGQNVPTNTADETDKMSAEAVKLFNAGKYAEALPIAKQAVALREQRHGKKHMALVHPLRNLAYIELKLNNRPQAQEAFGRVLEILESERSLSRADEEILAEMLEAAAFFDIADRTVSKSASRLEKAIAIRERINGKDALQLTAPLMTLGQILHGRGEFEKAAPLLARALEIAHKDPNMDTLELKMTASCALSKLGRNDEAAEIEKKYGLPAPNGPPTNPGVVLGGVVNGKAVSLAKPAYPAEAKRAGAEGPVRVKVLINEAGAVAFACAVDGRKELHLASENAAYRSTFTPTVLAGKPVKVSGVLTYNFVRN